jgi:hypothetical protein
MIAAMGNSAQHHFVIGYRYPPRYWKLLVDHAATVSLLTDVDGIVRQIEFIQRKRAQAGENRDIQSCLMAIRHALDSLLEMIAWILHEGSNSTRIMPPAVAFMSDPAMAFRRLENFYAQAAVPIVSSCWEAFANEADPLLSQVEPVSMDLRNAIQRHLILDDATPSRLEALGELFSQHI